MGIFADTYVVAFCNGIVKLVIETIYDFIDGKIMLKEIALKVTLKNILLFLSVVIIMVFSFHYYVNKEFSGLFGEITREYMGIIYITFIIYSNIKKKQ